MRTASDGPTIGNEQTATGRPLPVRYEVGAVLSGKYRLEALLGEGGMGAVWRASNLLLDLPVAIKLIRADLDRGELRARLQLEARSAAKLGHPSIVRVFDVGESELGDPFIVMEHLSGETLAQLISRGRLPATRAAQLLLPIIDALALAHARGIVHRDLKPDNVMIALEEQHVCPKILDFGIAKLTDPREVDLKLTQVGAVVGSPEYMSPEQARGREDIDASTDIWSVCVVLYEAVTGCSPFSATNLNALLRSIVEDDPKPLSEHGLDAPELWQILQRGLHKDRTHRYSKIADLGQALATWLMSQGMTEDASGCSLESKWFARKSDPLNLGLGVSTRSSGNLRSEMRDSNPDSTGIARGPFTKTIMPSAHGRTRTLGAAMAAASALFVLALFALGRSQASAKVQATHASAVSLVETASNASHRPTLNAAPAEALSAEAPRGVSVAPVSAPASASPASSAEHKPEVKPPAPAVRSVKYGSTPLRVSPAVPGTTAAVASPALATKPTRPLDLMAPY